MSGLTCTPQTALVYELEVQDQGLVELTVPFAPGVHITVLVLEEPRNAFGDLVAAAQSSLAFWDNPYDDEDWNYACTG